MVALPLLKQMGGYPRREWFVVDSANLVYVDPNVVGYHDMQVIHVSDPNHIEAYLIRAHNAGYYVNEITGMHNSVYLCQIQPAPEHGYVVRQL